MGYYVCEEVADGEKYIHHETELELDSPKIDRDEENIHDARVQEIQQVDKFGLGELVKKD